jgi:hypothetical protein
MRLYEAGVGLKRIIERERELGSSRAKQTIN